MLIIKNVKRVIGPNYRLFFCLVIKVLVAWSTIVKYVDLSDVCVSGNLTLDLYVFTVALFILHSRCEYIFCFGI